MFVFLISVAMQVPALLWLSMIAARTTWLLAPLPWLIAGGLTFPVVSKMLRGRLADEHVSSWVMTFLLYPFFAWWATSSLFFFGSGIVYLAAKLCHADTTEPLGITLGISGLLALWSLRNAPRIVELEVPLAGLPREFDGYRVAQISDVHCGAFTPRARVEEWVARLNATRPDLIAVTGDLVTNGDAFIEDVASALGNLDAPDGVFACMGNHDYFCDAERLVAALRDGGVDVLRNQGKHILRGDAKLYVAGIEDNWSKRSDLPRTLRDRDGAATLLLAHDPNHFPFAAKAGVMLQLSGHTHGGQIGLPVKGGRYNLARIITRFTNGLFREGASTLYVNRGAGTTGPPVRLFAPAELTVLTLRSIQS